MRKPILSRMAMTAISLVVLLSLSIGVAMAQATAKQLSTNFTLVNMSESQDATVNIDYIKNDGTAWEAQPENQSFTIPRNYGQVQVRQYFDTTMGGGQGSAVVSSNQQLNAVTQILARGQTPTQGAYTGFTGGSSSFYIPLAAKNFNTASGIANSQIMIQNTSNAEVDVTVDLVNFDGSIAYSKSFNDLSVGTAAFYDLSGEGNLPSAWMGSSAITSTGGQVVVVSNFFQGAHAMQTFNGFPEETLTPNWVVPLFFVRLANGLSTTVTIQNLSGATIPAGGIDLICIKNPNSPDPASFTVELPNELGYQAQYGFNPPTDSTLFPVSGWYGSCRVDAGDANVAVMIQMRYVNSSVGLFGTGAYEAIPEATSGTTMVVPLVAKRLPNGFATVVTIQNMDFEDDAVVDLIYTPAVECSLAVCDKNNDGVLNDSDKYIIEGITIISGGSIQRNHRLNSGSEAELALPNGWSGSLVVQSNRSVSGVVQMTNLNASLGDTFMVHDAFTQ